MSSFTLINDALTVYDSNIDITDALTLSEADNKTVVFNKKDVKIDIFDYEKKNSNTRKIKKYGGGGPENPKFRPMLFTLLSILFFTVLNEYCASVMYSDIVHDLGKEITTVQWITTAFVLVLAVGMVFSSFVAKHFYLRTIFFVSVTSFVLGSLICALANSFIVLLIGRIIQAVGTALLLPQNSTVILIMAPEAKLGFYNGLSMFVVFTGSALGPSLSGLITKYLGWRYLFALLIPIPFIGGIIGYWTIGNVIELDDTKLDFKSAILAVLGFGGVTYGLGNSGDYGFTSFLVIAPVIVGIISLILFFVWENMCKNPIISMKNLGSPYFIINILLSTLNDFTLIGWIAILPYVIQNSLGMNAFISGIALLPGDLFNAVLNVIGGEIYDKSRFKYGPIGILFILLGSLYFFGISVMNKTTLWGIIIAYCIGNIGLPLSYSIYTTAALTYVPPQSAPHASAIYYSFCQFFSALSSALYIALLNNFNSVPFVTSKDPLINGSSICYLVSIIFSTVTLIVGTIWSIVYFKDHDNKGNLKIKKMKKEGRK